MILYPPLIDDTIPAFTYGSYNTNGAKIKVPFTKNPAVASGVKLQIQIKDYFSSTVIYRSSNPITANSDNNLVIFDIPYTQTTVNGKIYVFPQVGQHYKIQIAYDDEDVNKPDLTYSSAALGKCIDGNMILEIENGLTGQVLTSTSPNCVTYIGHYYRQQLNEPLYSYRFDLKDSRGKIIETSGDIVWDNEKDKKVFEGFSIYNSAFKSTGSIIDSSYRSDDLTKSLFLTTDNVSLTKNTLYTETRNLAGFAYDANSKLFFQWDNDATSSAISLGLGTWNPQNYLNEIKKYNITATRSFSYRYTTNNYHYFAFSSIEISSVYDSAPEYQIKTELINGVEYFIEFTITTINGYTETKSQSIKSSNVSSIYVPMIEVQNDSGNVIILNANQLNDSVTPKAPYLLERKREQNNYWEVIKEANSLNIMFATPIIDNTLEPGTNYEYRVRHNTNTNNYTTVHSTALATLYTEDIFLSDKNKCLKIAFNPKVSSMKETILETKQDTIGGQYPMFYRNGQVRYREIPISGLISYQMDDQEMFMTNEELGLDNSENVRTISLIDYNIVAERKFREKVLKWLNNGEPKLFRSLTEGAYIVRLMNVSLSPNDTLGRMLWTFSATAYEIADYTLENLRSEKYNLTNLGV